MLVTPLRRFEGPEMIHADSVKRMSRRRNGLEMTSRRAGDWFVELAGTTVTAASPGHQ
jgi:hypothetical protein